MGALYGWLRLSSPIRSAQVSGMSCLLIRPRTGASTPLSRRRVGHSERMQETEDLWVKAAVAGNDLPRVDAWLAVKVGVGATGFLDDELQRSVVPRIAARRDRDVCLSHATARALWSS